MRCVTSASSDDRSSDAARAELAGLGLRGIIALAAHGCFIQEEMRSNMG